MAERSRRSGASGLQHSGEVVVGRPAEAEVTGDSKVEAFAEDLGRLLGTARAKAEGWIGQRQNVAQQLTDIRDTAADLLQQMGASGARMAAVVGRARRGRPKGSQNSEAAEYAPAQVSKRKRRKLSAKARRAISLAQKRRWSKVRAGK